MPIGTLVNVLTVVAGSLIGLLVHKQFPENIKKISFTGLGLCTVLLGVSMGLEFTNFIAVILSILLGGIVGEWLRLEDRANLLGDKLKKLVRSKHDRFTEGLATSFILFCVGSLTILGALQEGLTGNPELLWTKATLDGFGAIILSSVYGIGVLFSAIPLFLFQVGITLSASWLQPLLPEIIMNQISATGGVMIIGIGINLMDLRQIKVINFLPALLFIVLIQWIIIRYFAG